MSACRLMRLLGAWFGLAEPPPTHSALAPDATCAPETLARRLSPVGQLPVAAALAPLGVRRQRPTLFLDLARPPRGTSEPRS